MRKIVCLIYLPALDATFLLGFIKYFMVDDLKNKRRIVYAVVIFLDFIFDWVWGQMSDWCLIVHLFKSWNLMFNNENFNTLYFLQFFSILFIVLFVWLIFCEFNLRLLLVDAFALEIIQNFFFNFWRFLFVVYLLNVF